MDDKAPEPGTNKDVLIELCTSTSESENETLGQKGWLA